MKSNSTYGSTWGSCIHCRRVGPRVNCLCTFCRKEEEGACVDDKELFLCQRCKFGVTKNPKVLCAKCTDECAKVLYGDPERPAPGGVLNLKVNEETGEVSEVKIDQVTIGACFKCGKQNMAVDSRWYCFECRMESALSKSEGCSALRKCTACGLVLDQPSSDLKYGGLSYCGACYPYPVLQAGTLKSGEVPSGSVRVASQVQPGDPYTLAGEFPESKKIPVSKPSRYDKPIQEHGGSKYLRKIRPADGKGEPILVDVYAVLEAFNVTCPALQHLLKKALCAGIRGKGSKVEDIEGILDAAWRARELEKQRGE